MSRRILLIASLVSLPTVALANGVTTTDLFYGQDNLVGQLTVTDDGSSLTFDYEITDSAWDLTETHLYVSTEAPKKHSPGKFPYANGSPAVDGDSYTVTYSDLGIVGGENVWVAAHGVVEQIVGYEDPDYSAFSGALPSSATLTPTQGPTTGADSYWELTLSGGTTLDGVYDGWCVDTDRTMSAGTSYTVDVYSSLDDIPDGLIEMEENLVYVNYLINQGWVGQTSAGCGGTYTYGDVQRAVWELVEDNPTTAGLGSWSQCRVDELTADAFASGVDFAPTCDDTIAVLLVPTSSNSQYVIAQITLIDVGAECEAIYGDETLWAYGDNEFKQGWGWYFELGTCDTGSPPEGVE